ncbi:MAG TPA: cytochrome c biogenesis protein ResB [Verrucomicrobiae bacterium]|nr:cytochrome c biogenesis protein ResB [Verrucomicrobiae bacterium]
MGQATDKLNPPTKPLTARVFDRLASVKFAVTVVIIIAVACLVGTLLPQGADVARYLAKHPEAATRFDLLDKVGLTHVFSSWWFVGLLCVLSSSVAVCSTRRFATVRRTTGFARGRALGSMITHISFLLILAGAVIRGVWGQKGYLEFREGQTVGQFVDARGPQPLPFGIHLAKFEIERYDHQNAEQLLVSWPEKNLKAALPVRLDVEQKFGEFTLKILRYVPDFVVDMQTREITSRSNEPRNPAILVAVNGPTYHNHRWLFAKFPEFGHGTTASPLQMAYLAKSADGPIKSFKSTLDIVEGDAIVKSKTIEVNSPISYKGYTFYQSGYNPEDPSYTSLQVVKDPGVPVVYTGFSLMIVGLFIVFYLNPWLNERRKQA